jgi:hypothetical protein
MKVRRARDGFNAFGKGPLPGPIAMVALIAVAVQVGISQQQSQHQTDCLTQYANELYDSLQPRQVSAQKLQHADIAFKRSVAALLEPGHDSRDLVAVRKALAHNTQVADRLTTSRQANPYPPPPRRICAQ